MIKHVLVYLFWGSFFSPFVAYAEKYIFSDWEFLNFLFVMICADTMSGLIKAATQKNINSRAMGGMFNKIIVYFLALITTHNLSSFGGHASGLMFGWMNAVVYSAIMVREAVSIFENISIVQPDIFPKRLLAYLQQFPNNFAQKK